MLEAERKWGRTDRDAAEESQLWGQWCLEVLGIVSVDFYTVICGVVTGCEWRSDMMVFMF